jgi:uncharacterized C2H2 Zn-finger protein
LFSCDDCGARLKTEKSLRRHVRNVHLGLLKKHG